MKILRRLRRLRRDERGQALVEFALVLPILLLLVLGIIDFGRAWNLHQTITDAAREGARRAVVYDPAVTQDTVMNVIREKIALVGFNPNAATITFPDGFKQGTNQITTVRVEMPYRFGFLGAVFRFAGAADANGVVTLTTVAAMRNEG